MSFTDRLALSVPEAADALGVSANSIWNLLREDKIRRVRVGRRTLVSVVSLEAFTSGVVDGDLSATGPIDNRKDSTEGRERPRDEPTS